MKKAFFILIFLCFGNKFSIAQQESSYWYFGDSTGIRFNNNTVECLTDGVMPSFCGSSTISDSLGNLLFYSNGYHVWNKLHQRMPHGDSIFVYPSFSTAPQYIENFGSSSEFGVVILPFDSIYYVFMTNYFGSCCFAGYDTVKQGLYSIKINMQLDAGKGDVVAFNPLYTPFIYTEIEETIASVRHANGRDWWLITHKTDSSNEYLKFLITKDSIYGPFTQAIGRYYLYSDISSEYCFSPDGAKFIGAKYNGVLELYDFDRCTGELYNYNDLSVITPGNGYNMVQNNHVFGTSFSPSGELIYYNTWKYLIQLHPKPGETNVYERDTIFKNIYFNPNNIGYCQQLAEQRLGPDGKIYITSGINNQFNFPVDSFNSHLGVINNPDSVGAACDFHPWSIDLCGRKTYFGLPNQPNYNLSAIDGSACDTLGLGVNGVTEIKRSILNIYPNPVNDELTIEVLNGIAPKYIEITNSIGVTVIKFNQTKPNQQVNIKDLTRGIYFVKVVMNDGSLIVKKMVKE